MATRSPINRLNNADLPTFGRPTIATIGFGTDIYLDFWSGSRRPGFHQESGPPIRDISKRPASIGRQRRKYTRMIFRAQDTVDRTISANRSMPSREVSSVVAT